MLITTASVFASLFKNITVFVLFITGYGMIRHSIDSMKPLPNRIACSIHFSLFVVAAMFVRIPLQDGLFLDQRNTFIVLSGYFAGPPAIILSGCTAFIYRIFIGGVGTVVGCTGIALSMLLAAAIYFNKKRLSSLPRLAVAALLPTLLPLPVFLLISPPETGVTQFLKIGLPFALSSYASVLIAGIFLVNEEHRIRYKKQLELSEKRYRELFESLVDVTYRTNANGICEIISPSVEKICGYSPKDLIGRSINRIFVNPDEYKEFRNQLVQNGFVKNFEARLKQKDGTLFWGSLNAQCLDKATADNTREEGIIRDISSIKQREEEKLREEHQLRQNQKMESIGTLAGGIAHDFNNILAAILGYAEMAQQKIDEENPLFLDINGIIRSASRAKELVRHILIFSRRTAYETGPVEMYLMIKEVVKMIQATIPPTVTLEQTIKCRNGVVLADPTEIHQVILNICTNAVEAIDSKEGSITISLERKNLTRVDLLGEPDLHPGPFIVLTVSDTGPGIQPEYINRVFDPFFTTKEIGKGSGLGLSVVHGIVRRLGGFSNFSSEPGSNTSVTISFPEYIPDTAKDKAAEVTLPTGHEKILVVDDEPIVLDVTRKLLERLGYQVTTELHSEDALRTFEQHPNQFDLIITDQIMPVLTGEQLSKSILMINPNAAIIMCTGYSADIDAEKAKNIGIAEYILKPIEKRKLAELVRKVLDQHHVHA